MAALQLLDCSQPALVKLERVHYFPRQLLTADDLTADSEYFRTKLRRHNRFLHGWGTVCGLAVSPASTPELPWRVSIGDGYALGPYGDEIYVAEPVFLDLARCGPGAVTDPCAPGQLHTPGSATGGTIFVAIKYAECLARPVRAMPAGCACEEEACEYSRIRDSFQIECLTELPPSHQPPPGASLCDLIADKQLPLCPPCPAEPWIVLAQVTLPASPTTNIADNNIDNFTFRHQVFSTSVLQQQLIKCCCKEPEPELADLELTKEAAPFVSGSNVFTYKITVTNRGPSEARNVIVEDTLNPSPGRVILDVFNFSPSDAWKVITLPTLKAELATLSKDAEVVLRYNVATASPRPTGNRIINTASIRSDTDDPNEQNNEDTVILDLAPG